MRKLLVASFLSCLAAGMVAAIAQDRQGILSDDEAAMIRGGCADYDMTTKCDNGTCYAPSNLGYKVMNQGSEKNKMRTENVDCDGTDCGRVIKTLGNCVGT